MKYALYENAHQINEYLTSTNYLVVITESNG
jgi:hypothetical protein